MKKLYCLLSAIAFLAAPTIVNAQEVTEKYRRNSLCLVLVDEESMPKRDVILEVFKTLPVPEKYNDHNVGTRSFNPTQFPLTDADRAAFNKASDAGSVGQKKKGGFGRFMKDAANVGLGAASGKDNSTMVDQGNKQDYIIQSHKFMLEEQVAKQLFDKWFIAHDGTFTMDVVKDRGLYGASAIDIEKAKSSTRGLGELDQESQELVGNTFVVVSRYRFVSKDELVKEVTAVAGTVSALAGNAYSDLAVSAGSAALKASLGDGHYVSTMSFLFQLEWNKDVSNKFYSELWDQHDAYKGSDIFSLKYIGEEMAWAGVKSSIFTSKPEDVLIQMATVNATDAVLAKLEKKYDVFKTKSPLQSIDPLTASIGLKEGLEAGDKYEVLERIKDAETGDISYKRKTVLKVSKDQIWDNRYGADEERQLTGQKQEFKATKFEGDAKGLYPGLLLRQIK